MIEITVPWACVRRALFIKLLIKSGPFQMYSIWRSILQVACKSRTYTKAPGTEHACKAEQPAVIPVGTA